jgi:hypothetical protein
MGFFNSAERAYFKQRAYHHLENPKMQEVLLQKLTQFSQGNNVLEDAASNIDGFLWRDTSFSSTQLNSPFCNKGSLSPY